MKNNQKNSLHEEKLKENWKEQMDYKKRNILKLNVHERIYLKEIYFYLIKFLIWVQKYRAT